MSHPPEKFLVFSTNFGINFLILEPCATPYTQDECKRNWNLAQWGREDKKIEQKKNSSFF